MNFNLCFLINLIIFIYIASGVSIQKISKTVFVSISSNGDGSIGNPFGSLYEALKASINTDFIEWKIILFPGIYNNNFTKKINTNITLTKSYDKDYVISLWNDEILIDCMGYGYFINFQGPGRLTIDGNGGTIANCTKSAILSNGTLNIFAINFQNNKNDNGYGGVLEFRGNTNGTDATVVDKDMNLTIYKCIFKYNSVGEKRRWLMNDQSLTGGGAVHLELGNFANISACRFYGNFGTQGGAIFSKNMAHLYIEDSIFEKNIVGSMGLKPAREEDEEYSSIIYNNVPNKKGVVSAFYRSGGAIYCLQSQTITVDNVTIDSVVEIESSLFSFNQAEFYGGAIYLDNVEISINGSLFWNNTVFKDGAGVLMLGNLYANITSSFFWNNYINNVDDKGNVISTILNNIACGTTGSTSPTIYWENGDCNICSIKNSASLQFQPKNEDKYYPCGQGPSFLTLLITFCILAGVGTIVIVIMSVCFCSSYLTQKKLFLRRKRPNLIMEMDSEEKKIVINPFSNSSDSSLNSQKEDTDFDLVPNNRDPTHTDDDLSLDDFIGHSGELDSNTIVLDEKIESNNPASFFSQPIVGYPKYFDKQTKIHIKSTKKSQKKLNATSVGNLDSMFLKFIPYKDLEVDTKNPVGVGSFGIVYRGVWRNTEVAIKKLIKSLNNEQLEQFILEAQLLREVSNHKNIINLFGVCVEKPNYCLVTPYYKNGSIKDYYIDHRERKQWKWSEITKIAKQTAAGIDHLHKENVIHRDIAARNVLLNNNLQARISDFGLARVINNVDYAQTNSSIGAVAWMSYESIVERKYSRYSDSYSFGVFLWELCYRKTPFEGVQPIHIALKKVTKNENPPLFLTTDCAPALFDPLDFDPNHKFDLLHVPHGLSTLILSCWAKEPTHRPDFYSIFKTLSSLYDEYLLMEK
eukprot:TRINITY_DN4053_c0_g1_i1.p1 TRINITY_DN4053_c0_g1~~TRINITY_DN4053_c0_g1_i1.p1  ORF type:complete len:919 (-),score=241.13 TRINITY_DN4053_c0_g1_i1:62-2818(-)